MSNAGFRCGKNKVARLNHTLSPHTKRGMSTSRHVRFALATAALAWVTCSPATAAQRNFSFTYQTETLHHGQAKLIPWTTAHFGQNAWNLPMENRLEFGLGITDALEGAFFVDTSASAGHFEFGGVAGQLKYRLSDATLDALGFGLYLEAFLAPDTRALEPRLIFDKEMDHWVVALNTVFEVAWEKDETEYAVQVFGGAGYLVTEKATVGLEGEFASDWAHGEHEGTNGLLGPSFSYAEGKFWATFAVLMQPWNTTNDAGASVNWLKARILLAGTF